MESGLLLRGSDKMPLIKITGQGLCSIALLTGVLWGCFVAERLTISRARANAHHALEQIEVLRRKAHTLPASMPNARKNPPRPSVG
jgi:hypothetical protein